jgi:hypothetical protein
MKSKTRYKIVLLFLIFVVFTACFKEDDFKFRDVNLEIGPTMLVPLVAVDIDLEELLNLYSTSLAYVNCNQDDIVQIFYSDTTYQEIDLLPGIKQSKNLIRHDISGEIDIDIFENMEDFDVSLTDVNLDLFVKPEVTLPVVFREIQVKAVDYKGDVSEKTMLLEEEFLLHQDEFKPIFSQKISDFININDRPTKFLYEGYIEIDPLDLIESEIDLEKVGIEFYFNLDVLMKGMVKNIKTKNLLDFHLNENDDAEIETAELQLTLENALPFDFNLEMRILDSLDNLVFDFFDTAIELKSGTIVNQAVEQASKKEKTIPITKEQYRKILTASKVEMNAIIASANGGESPIVVKCNNALGLKIALKTTLVYAIDL